MLPTLNLQLLPLDTLDDAAVSAAPVLAEAGGEAESGFADLLRLRVDAALATKTPGGQFLPQSGSPLPVQADFAAAEPGGDTLSLSTIDLGQALVPTDSAGEISFFENLETTDIVLETAVLYGPLDGVTGADAEALTASLQVPGIAAPSVSTNPHAGGQVPSVAVTPSAINSGSAAADLDGKRVVAPRPATPNPLIAAAETAPDAVADKAALAPPTGTGLRLQGPLRNLQGRTAAINMANVALEAQDRQPPVDLARRLDVGPVQHREGFAETGGEPLTSRVLTPQVGHSAQAQAQPTTGTAQVPLSSVPTASTPLNNPYAATATGATDFIGTPVRESVWGDQLGERVVMMAGNQLKTAEIRLTPAELGPLRVQVAVDDGAAHVTFHAQHAVTREAIEQALPRLREMLAENGLALGQTDVSDRGVGEGRKDGAAEGSPSNQAADDLHDGGADADRQLAPRVTMSDALVDTFA
jgi:flagellar hook-length control protein FliK